MHPVTRIEIADHIEHVFAASPPTRDDLVVAAQHSGAREEALTVLRSLPDRRYSDLRHLWTHLRDVPVEA